MNYYIRSNSELNPATIEKILWVLNNTIDPAEYFRLHMPNITRFAYDRIDVNGGGEYESTVWVKRD